MAVPRTQVCPDHVPPFRAFADAFFARNSLDPTSPIQDTALWHGSRGLSGKSFMLSLLAIVNAELHGSDVNLLGGSLAQSLNIHEHVGAMLDYEEAPDYMIVERTNSKIQYTNRARIRPLTASQKTVRGPHPPRLLLDEIDEMELAILDAALGQPMPQRNHRRQIIEPYTVMCSTWQNPQGTFTEIKRRAEERRIPIYQWCAAEGSLITTDRGPVPIESVLTTDLILTRQGWRQVQHVTLMGIKETVTLRTGGGKTLSLTPDHLVSTPSGWVPAGALGESDTVHVVEALPTVAPSVGPLVEVDPGVRMTLRAVVEPELSLHDAASSDVVGQRCDLAVSRGQGIDAGVDLAAVVDGVVGGNLDAGQAYGQAVSQLLAPRVDPHAARDLSVPLRVAAQLPQPASIAVDDDAVPDVVEAHLEMVYPGACVPVYDIGVFGDHEFIAEGIVVHNCFLESANPVDGWLSQKAIESKRNSIPKQMWETEYELNEPSIGNRAFDTACVDACFSLDHLPMHEDPDEPSTPQIGGYIRHKEAKNFEEFVYEHPLRGAEYVIAADWAKERDYTVIGVGRVDIKPYRIVYYLRVNRRPYPQMIGFFNKAMQRYNAMGIHDATGGGDMIDDYVLESAEPFVFSGEKRDAMLTEYVSDIEKRTVWRIPRIPSIYIEHKYAQVGDLYARRAAVAASPAAAAKTQTQYHLPDSVAMMGMLNHLMRRRAPLVGAPDLRTPANTQTRHEKVLDPPAPKGSKPPRAEHRRTGDVQKQGQDTAAYSLGV